MVLARGVQGNVVRGEAPGFDERLTDEVAAQAFADLIVAQADVRDFYRIGCGVI